MNWMKFLTRTGRDRDRALEIEAHLEEVVQHHLAQGMSLDEAQRRARLQFGNPRAHREAVDDLNRLPILDILWRDLRYALRMLRRSPAFSVAVIATLALVIGATSAVFSLANSILLRRLPYPDPDRLAIVQAYTKSPRGENTGDYVDGAMWEAVHDRATKIDAAVLIDGATGVNFVNNNKASFVHNQRVGAGFFRVLGTQPFLGREFAPDEDRPGGPALAILSYAFWQRTLYARPDIIGQPILLRGEPFTVIGVMPDGFKSLSGSVDVWTPLRPSRTGEGGGTNFMMVARLKPGASWTEAGNELRSLGKTPFQLNAGIQREDYFASLVLAPIQRVLSSDTREPIVMLSWAVGVVLLMACVNIAALLLARSGGRATEIATRMALGSGRGAVIRQLMVESAVLGLIGGVLGLLVGLWSLEVLRSIGGATYTAWKDVALDGRAVVATMGLSLVTSVAFGLVPAWQASCIDVRAALADGGTRSIAGGSRHIIRRALVSAEVALGVVMLVTGGLLLRQFWCLRSLDPGFKPDRLYSASVSLQDARYKDPAIVNRLFDGSIEALRRKGFTATAVSQGLPYQRLLNVGCDVEGRDKNADNPSITNIAYVTPGFFETFGIPITHGRPLDQRDRADTTPVVVVNELFASIYFNGQPAIGRRLRVANGVREIVGVSANVQQFGSGFSLSGMGKGPVHPSPTVYIGAPQTGAALFAWFSPVWTVRAPSAAQAGLAIQEAISATDPWLPIGDVRSMAEVTDRSMAPQRLMMTLVGVFAAEALLMAAVGLYGLIAHSVAERTREFGIRLALGATASQIIVQMASSGALLAAVGAVVGAGLSVPATHLVESFLFTVSARDTMTYVGVGGLLCGVAVLASVLPTLRIARMDPARTLRD